MPLSPVIDATHHRKLGVGEYWVRVPGLEIVFQNYIASLRYKTEIVPHLPNIASQFNFHTMCMCEVILDVCHFTGLHYRGRI
jgi:hypothetical protein